MTLSNCQSYLKILFNAAQLPTHQQINKLEIMESMARRIDLQMLYNDIASISISCKDQEYFQTCRVSLFRNTEVAWVADIEIGSQKKR